MNKDILEVFNIQKPVLDGAKKKKRTEPAKKQTGINRELYQLLGENTPGLHVKAPSKFKQRLGSANSKPAEWHWVKFKNEARKDELELSHWQKGSVKQEKYPFAQYNQKLKLPEFNEIAYERLIKEDDEANEVDWDYKETAYLFELCNLYDLRWLIINDRYEYEGHERSLEDLKERFYSVCQTILVDENKLLKEAGILDEGKNKLIDAVGYDKQKELDRKKYLERLLDRLPAEIAEEESLVIEARRFEQAAQKMLAERGALLHLLDSPSSSANISQYSNSQGLAQLYNALMLTDKTKKRKQDSNGNESDSKRAKKQPLAAQVAVSSSTTPTEVVIPDNPVAQLLAKKLTKQEEEAYGISYHPERLQPGVFLRSAKIATYKTTIQVKVNSTLNEMGLPTRPVMVSEKIVKKFDQLTEAIATLIETKKQIDKMEAEQKLIEKQAEQ